MITITTMDGSPVATLRDRDGIVTARQIRRIDASSARVPVGDSILSLGRYLWSSDGVRVLPQHYSGDRYVLRAVAAVELGRRGGKVTGGRKAAASRANGRKGGRPRKE